MHARQLRLAGSAMGPIQLAALIVLAVHSMGCSYLSYQVAEKTTEVPGPKVPKQETIGVEHAEIVGSQLRLQIVHVTGVDQKVDTHVERTVDYNANGGLVYEGIGQPIVDPVLSVIYFIPDAIIFLGSSLVMGPAGAIAAIDSSQEKTVEVERKTTPVANATVEVSIDQLKVWEREETDQEGRVAIDLSDVHDYGTSGPIAVRVRTRSDGKVAIGKLSESQLADLRPKPAPAQPASVVLAATAAQPGSAAVALTVTVPVDTRRRVALVIGNSQYHDLPALSNPDRDATDLAAVLKSVGFEVILRKDQNLAAMKAGLREFASRLGPDSVGLFYYAGHAVQAEGSNYLVPIGADIASADEVPYETLDLARVLGKMEASKSPLKLVFVDACRNDPFSRFRGGTRGLAVTPAPRGTLIAYATAPGDVAADGNGRNSPFARHLIEAIGTPGLELKEVISQVQQGVYSETDSKQRPWLSSDIFLPFYFNAPKAAH